MSKFKILVSLVIIMITGLAFASSDDIAERIKRVGDVCVQGVECSSEMAAPIGMATAVDEQVAAVSSNVESNFNKSCATCHNVGIAGAPKFGDAGAWASRIEKGIDVLYASTINGLPPGMPQKGMCFSCSDDDLRALVDYMVDAAK
ncbi:c-type cytochrome [Gammaproteobacteria bacterium]|nr:c-type cytochrome [Gammaproteobacteria bacterium]